MGYMFWLQGYDLFFSGLPTYVATTSLTDTQKDQILAKHPAIVIQDISTKPELSSLIESNGFFVTQNSYYVCKDFTCLPPTSSFEDSLKQL